MAKNVTGADIFGGMFKNIPAYRQGDAGTGGAESWRGKEEEKRDGAVLLKRSCLFPFKNHPFRVTEDAQMKELAESIRMYGVKEPLLVRPKRDGDGYEIISGHRRNYAAGLAGLNTVPARIEELDDDDAAVLMVDSNNKREVLLASEKAWAYRIRAEALKHQGRRSDLMEDGAVPEGMQSVGEQGGDSIRTVQRYIRLTYLKKELLQLVDEGKLAVGAGYSISFFNCGEQACIWEYYKEHQVLPDVSQTELLAALRKEAPLDQEMLHKVLAREAASKREAGSITLRKNRLQKYFPPNVTKEYMESVILKLLEQWSGGTENGQEAGTEPDMQMSIGDYPGVVP